MTNVKLIYARSLNDVVERNGSIPWTIDGEEDFLFHHIQDKVVLVDEAMYKYPQRPKVTGPTINSTEGLYYEAFCAARNMAAGKKDVVILGAGFLIPEVERHINQVCETVILNNLVSGTKFYKHQGNRELVSEHRTIAEVDGHPYEAVRRFWMVKNHFDSSILNLKATFADMV